MFDDTMPPIYDDYNDDYECFTPTITNKKDFTYVESINSFMHVDHDKNVLSDSCIVDFIHDATESYYERENMVVGIFMLLKHLSLC